MSCMQEAKRKGKRFLLSIATNKRQCEYTSVALTCTYCTSKGIGDCHKITRAGFNPFRTITTYDPSDDPESIQELGILYDQRLLEYRGRVIVVFLARAFMSHYGQWVSHRGLRHAILTHLCGNHGI